MRFKKLKPDVLGGDAVLALNTILILLVQANIEIDQRLDRYVFDFTGRSVEPDNRAATDDSRAQLSTRSMLVVMKLSSNR